MEQRQMRVEHIPVGRIMLAAQGVEPSLILAPEQRRDDQRSVQIST